MSVRSRTVPLQDIRYRRGAYAKSAGFQRLAQDFGGTSAAR